MNTKSNGNPNKSPSELISDQISSLRDWRGEKLAQIRNIIKGSDPEITEEWKWGTPVWSHNDMVCSAAAFKDHIRINFFKGAALEDPKKLFNTGLEAKASRGIDLREGDEIPESNLIEMVRRAVAYNLGKKQKQGKGN